MTRRKKSRRLRDLLRAAAKSAPRERQNEGVPAKPRKQKERFTNAGRKQKLALGLIEKGDNRKGRGAPKRTPRLKQDPAEVAAATRRLLEEQQAHRGENQE